ncbi:hypothetical protein LN042_14510 [Kitasatospora sp. RB6PN24]|nr:hypothetical protein [Kitasatospora humi]
MAAADHQGAVKANSEDPVAQLAWRRLTTRHADRLAEIMDEHGWPTAALVGEDGARAAWLIAQHADRQLDVQRRALALMDAAVTEGAASPRDLAFLRDRTLVNEGRPQIYGTQIAGIRDGAPVPFPCEEPELMDARRAEVGIPPFAEYVAQFAVA